MDLVLEVRTGRDQVTMACHGKLIGGKEAEAFRRSAMLLIGGFDRIILNLAGVRTVDCGGLGSLASVLAMATDKGTQVKVIHASALIAEELRLTGLEEFLEKPRRMHPQLVVSENRVAVA
jgi:anti-anti-sigma factor